MLMTLIMSSSWHLGYARARKIREPVQVSDVFPKPFCYGLALEFWVILLLHQFLQIFR